jgi:hypothetical protein
VARVARAAAVAVMEATEVAAVILQAQVFLPTLVALRVVAG